MTAGALLLATATIVSRAAPPPAGKLGYNRDVRPILADNCFPCHGPDSAARKAGLRLDRPGDARAARPGGAAIVPGDSAASLLVQRIFKADNDPLRMPPAAGHKSLTDAQRRTLVRWIEEGAAYETHWSYIAPKRPALPAVKNLGWVKNPIDRFILARLEKEGLTPAPEADRRTLARRLALDLTGLPPDPADVRAFVADTRPDAYERLVDKFLANPAWGEHRGRYWLDAARYADTHGIHIDNFREIWSYRDWVIDAFNRNMPFDQFTIEQLAGDLLPNRSLEQQIATGFTRCNITTSEGGAIDEEYKVLYCRDRTETTAQVWLGTTAGCAVCHDHKFDPLSTREFYSLSAYFNNTTQPAMDGNVQNTPPTVFVPRREDRPRWSALKDDLKAATERADARKASARPDFDTWLATAKPESVTSTIPTDGLAFHAALDAGDVDGGAVAPKSFAKRPGVAGPSFAAEGDFEKNQSWTAAAWVKLPPNAGGAILARMDEGNDYRGWDLWVEGNKIGSHIIHKWPDNALKVVARDPVPANEWHHVCVTYDGGGKPGSIKVYVDGAMRPTDTASDGLRDTIKTPTPLRVGQRSAGAGVENAAIQDARIYTRTLPADEIVRLARGPRTAYLIARGAGGTAAEKDELFLGWLTGKDETYLGLSKKVSELQAEESAIRSRGTIAHVAQERTEPATAYILFRGEYDKRRDQVSPATPAILPAMPADYPKNRLGLAKWLLLPSQPLTARVTVNRFWQEIFGTGIVRTAGDFGITGELPTNPELLDWLAVEFREKGWDIKKFFKLVVTSAAYRQSSQVTPEKRRKDPANLLLSRGSRYRMDAEMVRDYALASSGLLVRKLGGPSVKPYQPDGVWEAVAMIGSNTRDYRRDSGENLYRRSMYTFWKRSAPPASMEIFNAPNRESCTVRRERTNTPLQALVTLNDVQFVEAARNLAEKALRLPNASLYERLDFLAERLTARPFTPTEKLIVESNLADLSAHYAAHPDEGRALVAVGESKPDPGLNRPQLAAWTLLVNQLLNLDEVLNK